MKEELGAEATDAASPIGRVEKALCRLDQRLQMGDPAASIVFVLNLSHVS
jgi:hypothetical protein